MTTSSPRSGTCRRNLTLAAVVLLALTATAQGWQRVVNLNDRPGSAIGGGAGNTLYAGLNQGHVFRSTDNGLTWTGATNGLVDSFGGILLPKAFVVTPTGRVIRGGDNASWNNKVGSPIFYSDNQGANWTEVPLPFASSARNPAGIGISDLVLHQGALYFSDVLSEGVWKSTDNGLTWVSAGEQLPTMPFLGNTKTYNAIASAGSALLTVQASKGVFRSTDGGATWAQAVNGIPGVVDSPLVGGRSWNGTDVVGGADGTAFAVVDSRLYRSRDGGASWTEVGVGILQGPNPFVPSVIQPNARKVELLGDRVFVSTTDGNPRFFEGTALGESWTEIPRIEGNAANGGILAQSFYAHNGALYFAGDKGIHRLDLAAAVRTNIAPVVTVIPAPPALATVARLYANVGAPVTATAIPRGTAPFTYEWRLNDTPLAGQTLPVLNFTPADTNQSGTVSVVVANAGGRTTNTVGPLLVAPAGPGHPDFSFRPQNSGSVTAFAIAPDGGVFYGGPFSSQLEAYTGVRRTFADGQIAPAFITGAVIGSGSGPGFSAGSPRALLPLGDGSVLVGAADTSDGARYYRRLLPSGALDASWPWPNEVAGGPRKLVRLADGKFLIAGGSVGGIHRLNPDGTFDPTFRGPASIGRFQADYVSDFAVLPSRHILIVGEFDEVDLVRRVGIARLLPSGALDRGWVPASTFVGAAINTLAVQPDGKILIGGNFTTLGNQPRRGLARLNADGSLDPTLGDIMPNISPSPTVNALALQPDGKFWVGGNFFAFGGHNYVVRLNADGTLDPTLPSLGLDAAAGGTVNALRFAEDGRLWVAAPGLSVGGQSLGNLVRFFTDRAGPTLGYAGFDQAPDLGTSTTLRGTVTGPFTGLQWRFQGVPISGANGLELPLNNVTLAASGAYDLIVTSAGGSHTSAPVNVRVRGPVVIDQAPLPAVVALSNSVSLAVSAFGKLPLGYQWLKDGEVLAKATNRTLALTNLQLTASGDYAVRVSGGDGTFATSEPAFLTVVPPPGSTNATFRLALPAANGFKDIAFLPDGRAIVAGDFAGRLARVNIDGSVDSAFQFDASDLIELNALERQPDGKLVILVRLNSGGGPFVVRRLNPDGSRDGSFAEVGVFSGTDLKLTPDGGIVIADQAGVTRVRPDGTLDQDFGQRAKLNNAAMSLDVDAAGRIYVTGYFTTVGGQPRPQLARLLPDGALDTTFAPTNIFSSQWFVTALADGALVGDLNGFYRFTETGTRDDGYGWGTRLAAWDVTSTGLLVGVQADTQGNGVIRGLDGTAALPFGAMKVPASLYGYGFLRVAPDGAFWLAKGAVGTADSATLLYRLNGTVTPLALLTSPQSQTVNAGTNVTFTAAATGTSKVRYQWQRNGEDLTGETNATLVLTNAQPVNHGDYAVVVSNRSGSQTSRVATLVVLAAPEILSFIGGGELGLGNTLLLSVNARGVAPLTYRWRRNGVPLPGGTAANYTNRAVELGDAGAYYVVVANSLGSVTSAPITVSVVVRPGAVITSFPDLGFGQGVKELNLLPDGFFLADGVALNRYGQRLFTLPATTTDLREKIVVHPVLRRIYTFGGSDLPAYDLLGVRRWVFPGAGNVAFARLEPAGSLLVGSVGFLAGGPARRISLEGEPLNTFTPAMNTVDLAPQPDGRVVALNWFQASFQGLTVNETHLARLNADGSFDSSFTRSTNRFPFGQRAERIALDRQGRVLVFGSFETFGGQARAKLVRLNADGSLDESFAAPAINGAVVELAEQLNGKLVIVGAFTQVDGQPRSLIARLNPDGSHDVSFNPGTGLTNGGGQNIAYDVALLPTGEILVAGTFNRADGLPRTGLALLTGDTTDLYFNREPADAELALGGAADLVAAGTGTSAVTYQWFKDGEALAGQTGPTLPLNEVTAATAGDYRVVIRNAAGELASRVAKVSVIVPPIIAAPPVSLVRNDGEAATFQVTATGLHLAYQWRHAGTNLPGATNATFTIGAATKDSVGAYAVVVSNLAGSVTGAEARLRLRPAPIPDTVLPNPALTNGLFARYPFDGNTSSTIGPTGWSGAGNVGYPAGIIGSQAAGLHSGSAMLSIGSSGTRLIPGSTYSIGFWVNPEGTNSFNAYSFVVGSSLHFLFFGGTDNVTGGKSLLLAASGATAIYSDDPRALVPNLRGRWTQVVVTYRGGGAGNAGNFSVYLDGEPLSLTGSTESVALPAIGLRNRLGGLAGGAYGTNERFALDDLRLFNRAISATEVASMYERTSSEARPAITSQPTGGAATPGGTFAFNVSATGEGLFYEWYRGETLLPDADGPALNLSNLTAADAGDYRVVISNSGGSTNSVIATLTVNAATDPFMTWATAAGLTGDKAQPGADADGDGANNLAEFYYGTSPTAGSERPSFPVATVQVGGVDYPAVTIVRRQDAGSAQLTTQVASSVLFSDYLGSTVVSTTPLPDGFERVVIRSNAPEASRQNQFFRLTVQQ